MKFLICTGGPSDSGKVYSVQLDMIKFVSNLQHFIRFVQILLLLIVILSTPYWP